MLVLQTAPIEALCWQNGNGAGVQRHALLAEAGSYSRHLPCRIDTAEMIEWAGEYPPLGDSSVQRTPPVICYELHDARVTSQGCVITRDNHVVRESLGNLLTIEGLPLKGLKPLGDGRFEQDLFPARRIRPPSLLLKRAWWRNFGHWMLEAAAPLALLRAKGALRQEMHIVTGRFEEPPMIATAAATLAALWPWPDPAVEQHDDDEMILFDRLYYTTPVHDYICQVPSTVQVLRRYLVPEAGQAGPKRIFLDRTTQLRRLVNQDDVRALCVAYGCQPVQPADFTLLEQVRLFRDAEVIVGIKGSDFVNAMFCAPWATLVVLTPADFPDPMVWDLSAHGPLNYFEIFGALTEVIDATGRNPFAIPLDRLMAVMDEACAPLGPGSVRNVPRYSMNHWMARGYMPWVDDALDGGGKGYTVMAGLDPAISSRTVRSERVPHRSGWDGRVKARP
jgi:hypothetical protein